MAASPGAPTSIVIFDVPGDLARRNIMPALRGVAESVRGLGAGGRAMTRHAFRETYDPARPRADH